MNKKQNLKTEIVVTVILFLSITRPHTLCTTATLSDFQETISGCKETREEQNITHTINSGNCGYYSRL